MAAKKKPRGLVSSTKAKDDNKTDAKAEEVKAEADKPKADTPKDEAVDLAKAKADLAQVSDAAIAPGTVTATDAGPVPRENPTESAQRAAARAREMTKPVSARPNRGNGSAERHMGAQEALIQRAMAVSADAEPTPEPKRYVVMKDARVFLGGVPFTLAQGAKVSTSTHPIKEMIAQGVALNEVS